MLFRDVDGTTGRTVSGTVEKKKKKACSESSPCGELMGGVCPSKPFYMNGLFKHCA